MNTHQLLQNSWFKLVVSLVGLLLFIRGCNHLLGNDASTPESVIRSYMDGYLTELSEPPFSARLIGFDPPVKKTGFAGSEYTETTARYQVSKSGSTIDLAIIFEIYPDGHIFAIHHDQKREKVR